MPLQKIEQAGGATAVWGSAAAIIGQLFGWVSTNATLCGLLIAFGGLVLQSLSAKHNRKLRDADELRKQEEHELKMKILLAELTEQQSNKGVQFN